METSSTRDMKNIDIYSQEMGYELIDAQDNDRIDSLANIIVYSLRESRLLINEEAWLFMLTFRS